MRFYKHKGVNIKWTGDIYTVLVSEKDDNTTNSGVYTMFEVDPKSTYTVNINYGKFHGNISLWIANEANKILEYSDKYFLDDIRRSVDYCLTVKDDKRI